MRVRRAPGGTSGGIKDRGVIPADHAAYITLFRALGAILITNAHFNGVYPSDILSNGGLLGDVMFFAAAGYSLKPRYSFPRWYAQRIIRIYVPVWLVTVAYLALGLYDYGDASLASWLIYPTYYHFVASIMVLYVPVFFVLRTDWLRARLPVAMLAIALIHAVVYVSVYDASYYHIDNVREPMIRPLFLEAMLIGAYFRHGRKPPVRSRKAAYSLLLLVACGAYAATKLALVSGAMVAEWQIVNQWLLFAVLFLLLATMSNFEASLRALPPFLQRGATFIAGITLEIYLVQYAVIPPVAAALPFPLNWLALVLIIGALAWIASRCSRPIVRRAIAATSPKPDLKLAPTERSDGTG